jgi:5-methylcytosine-specific restriction endonuclease McrA
MRNEKGQFIKGYQSQYRGANSPVWSGGAKKCFDCGVVLSSRGHNIKRCRKCYFKTRIGEKNNKWKGGEATAKIRAIAVQHARVTRQKGNGGSYTAQEWLDLIKKFDFMCLCCKRKEPEIKLTADHILPISMGGTSFITNIQPLCKSCNCRKWAKHIDFISQFYEIKEKTIKL